MKRTVMAELRARVSELKGENLESFALVAVIKTQEGEKQVALSFTTSGPYMALLGGLSSITHRVNSQEFAANPGHDPQEDQP